MSDDSRVVIVTGIPGVGKTTVIDFAVKKAKKDHHQDILVLNFGTAMFELASKRGVKDRDEMRRLPTSAQRKLQEAAGKKIANMAKTSRVIVDTHTLIQTGNGYLIGLPEWVVRALKPKTIVLVESDPKDIASRRSNDASRKRDEQVIEDIETHQQMCRAAAVAAATLVGATVKIVKNLEGQAEAAGNELCNTLME
ncbi:MAG: adenylate kinase [Candidatus Thorarchaeota archaeon]